MGGDKQDIRSLPGWLPLLYKGRQFTCRKGKYIRDRCPAGRDRDRCGIRCSGKLNEFMKESILSAGDLAASILHLPRRWDRVPFNVHGIDRLGRIQSDRRSCVKMFRVPIVII